MPRTLAKIEKLILDTMEHATTRLGKPEQLRHQLSGYWSRRINLTDRMVYSIDEEKSFDDLPVTLSLLVSK